MKQRCLVSILCFVLISFRVASVSAQTCDSYWLFKPNSTYDANRRLILSSLPSNVSDQDGLFYNGSIGQEPNRVYAIGMCIPGSNSDDCFDCIKTASDGLLESCPNQTDAYTWPGDPTLCHVHYSNTSFSGTVQFNPRVLRTNTGDINPNITEFTKVWEELTVRMITAASTAKSSPYSSNNYYKAEIAALTPIQNIYALMQCTPDLSSPDCEYCRQKQGGVVMRPSCFLRWNLYTYSQAFGNITVDSPPPRPSVTLPQPAGDQANTTDNAGVVVAIAVAAFVTVLILLVLGLFFSGGKNHPKQLKLNIIEAATDKFASSNKLGQGGFGEVFKGTLPNGTEVAVKRLSKASVQGAEEFKNEVIVVAKLHHRNLVRLLGFCLEGEEKILVYEFVPNKSLDYFLFDPRKQRQLDWKKRYNIIGGITRGILYLHQDSRFTVIHRDLKASNILLDADMNTKIADFGMARIFGIDQSRLITNRIAGTRGYMPPEYVMHGLFSTKSDVNSFGVLVLEIICGRSNRFVHQSGTTVENLVTYAWRSWRNRRPLELVDPTMSENFQTKEVTRCIHIALLCVQEDPTDRPSLLTIMLMFTNNSIILPVPQPPGFFFPNRHNQELDGLESSQSTNRSDPQTINNVTITDLEPR